MRVYGMVSCLSLVIFVACVGLAASQDDNAIVESSAIITLNSQNFQSTTASGKWFIKFYGNFFSSIFLAADLAKRLS